MIAQMRPRHQLMPLGRRMTYIGIYHFVPFGIYPVKKSDLKVPLKLIEFHASIHDGLSSVEITQTYHNVNKSSIECQYIFPVDYASMTVTGLSIKMDGKTIEGKILPKEKADEKYTDAIAAGNTVAKAEYDEKQPDLLKMRIGNMLAGKTVVVVTRYVKLLEVEDNSWCFRIPLTYTPRYEEQKLGAAHKVKEKPGVVKGTSLPYTWSLNMDIVSSRPITRLVCSSHAIKSTFSEGNLKANVVLDRQTAPPDRDLVVLYRAAQAGVPAVIIQKSPDYQDYAAFISFFPHFGDSTEKPGAGVDENPSAIYKTVEETELTGTGDYVFLLDCSGSMRGPRIELAKSALRMFLQSLPIDSLFNIVVFGYTYKSFEPASVPYSAESLKRALEYLVKVNATMGGTNISAALESIMIMPYKDGYPRNIFMLTDGAVEDPEHTVQIVKNNAFRARVHALGIGSGASRYLVKGCALAGQGDFQFATEGEDIAPKIVSALAKAAKPSYSGAKVIWPEGLKVVLQTPYKNHRFNIYMDEPFTVMAILSVDKAESLAGKKVTLQVQDTLNKKPLSFDVTLDGKVDTGRAIYQAAVNDAFEKVIELTPKKKEGLSLKYNVLSEETSFVAIQKNMGASAGEMKTVIIPIAVTKDLGPAPAVPKMSRVPNGDAMMEMCCRRVVPIRMRMKCAKRSYAVSKSCVSKPMLAEKAKAEVACCQEMLEDDEMEECKAKANATNIARKLYEVISELQEFTGQWMWKEETLKALKLDPAKAGNVPADLKAKFADEALLKNVWITILAIAKLESECATDVAAWQLIYLKANKWLKMNKVKYEDFKTLAAAAM